MRLRLLPVLLLLAVAVSLSAQSVRDSVTIEVVDVPVFVNVGGEPVRDLTRDDFELYVNGKRQPIDYFDVVGAAETDGAPSLRERRLFLILFDVAFSPPHALGRAQKAAAHLIDTASPEDLVAIATYSSRRGVWFATPFTSDRVALARGISRLSESKSGDPLSLVLTETERQSLGGWEIAVEPADRTELIDRISGAAIADIMHAQLQRAVENQLEELTILAGRLAPLQGQKHVVLLSEGFDGGGARNAYDLAGAARAASFAINDRTGFAMNPATPTGHNFGPVWRFLGEMSRAFQEHDILLHTLDLKGVSSLLGSTALFSLATETGGRFVHNRNDLGDALVDLTGSVSYGYVLGFKPAAVKRGHNAIEVKVKDLPRGARVHHRKGFAGTPHDANVHEGLYLADVLLNDVQQSGTAPALEANGDALAVRVPLQPLAAQLGKGGTAELLVYLFDADNKPVGFRRIVIDVPADAAGDKTFAIELPEEAEVAKALLRVDDSLGFSKTEL